MPEISSQSMALTSLFDTFVPDQGFGEMLNSSDPSIVENELWMNDSLFGFMESVDRLQGAKSRNHEGPVDETSR